MGATPPATAALNTEQDTDRANPFPEFPKVDQAHRRISWCVWEVLKDRPEGLVPKDIAEEIRVAGLRVFTSNPGKQVRTALELSDACIHTGSCE